MAELYHSVAIVLSRQDRGKTALQWRISPDDADRFITEFRARFGEPNLESTTEAAVIDEASRVVNASGGHVVVTRA